MNRMAAIFLASILFLTGCLGPNLLTYKYRVNYREINVIRSDTTLRLFQRITHHRPGWSHGSEYSLELTILDTAAASEVKKLDLQTDTSIVKSEFGRFSNAYQKTSKVTGWIEIMDWSNGRITLKENVTVKDSVLKGPKKIKGTRTFVRKNGW